MPIHSELPPPRTWEDFEELCIDLFAVEWNDPHIQGHGRPGQKQDGVDIVGKLPAGGIGGIQCKKKRSWPPTFLTVADIDEEVANALNFTPALKSFTVTTTAADDAALQQHARDITEKHESAGLFSVYVMGWYQLCVKIKRYPSVLQKHFRFVVTSSQSQPLEYGPWYIDSGKLEMSGGELSIACREMARNLKVNCGSKLLVRLREADKLDLELAAVPTPASVEEREARFEKTRKLDSLRDREGYLSRGLTLMLGEPSIGELLTYDTAKPHDAATCVSAFVEEYLRPGRGTILRSWTKYIISPKGRSDVFYGWVYLTPEEVALWSDRQLELMKKYTDMTLLSLFWELPEEILLKKGIPEAVHAILRAIDDGISLERLRQEGMIEIVRWEIGDD